jgi:hypothetical protein
MIQHVVGIVSEIWTLFYEMAPYLLFGFWVAGLMNLVLSKERVLKHLSGNRFSAVWKAALIGVPLPLCSCGVIPAAAHLEKQGASRAATLSFLISTPTTGVDSIVASYGMLGPLLTIARPITALIAGFFTGVLSMLVDPTPTPSADAAKPTTSSTDEIPKGFVNKLRYSIAYGFTDLLPDITKWLIIGIVIGGFISYLLPAELVEAYLSDPVMAYGLMLLIGIPMYICATGSIPIATALMLKGLSPGAGFVFLFAGPATNTATLSFVGGKLGKKTLLIYLSSILITSVLFGAIIDYVWHIFGKDVRLISGAAELLPDWLKLPGAILLAGLMLRPYLRRKSNVSLPKNAYYIPDMNCQSCESKLRDALKDVPGVEEIETSLPQRILKVNGSASESNIREAIQRAGYKIGNHAGQPKA